MQEYVSQKARRVAVGFKKKTRALILRPQLNRSRVERGGEEGGGGGAEQGLRTSKKTGRHAKSRNLRAGKDGEEMGISAWGRTRGAAQARPLRPPQQRVWLRLPLAPGWARRLLTPYARACF